MLKKILKWGYIPVSALFIAIGMYSNIKEASTWGLSSWIWIAIGYAILLAISLVIIIALSNENKSLRKPLEEQNWNKLREVKINQRQIYSERKQQILDTLLKLDNYLANTVDNQTINAKQFVEVFSRAYKGSFIRLFIGSFTYSSKSNQKRFLNYNLKFTLSMLARLNASFRDYKLGTLVVLNKDEYKKIDKQIRELENGFSVKVINDINQVILYSQIVNCLRLLDPERTFWAQIQNKYINQKHLLSFKTMLATSQWQIPNIMDNSRGQVTEDIDKYLCGD